MEGFLPHPWWEFWFVVSIPIVIFGIYRIRGIIREKREALPLLALSGAFIFVLSSLKLPSVTGSCSHPTGTGLSAIFFGAPVTSVLATIVLIYQALFLAHGGLTTLGANIFSMGIAGPFIGWIVYRWGTTIRLPFFGTVFLAAMLADLSTYIVTSAQLALAFPATAGGFIPSFAAFLAIFAVTQVPIAIIEGAVIMLTVRYIMEARPDLLARLSVFSEEQISNARRPAR